MPCGLLVGLEQRHQLGVAGADDRVAADRDRGRLPEPGGAERRGHLRRHAARARDHADRARACRPARRSSPGPPMPPILITSGTMMPRQLGPMMRAPRRRRQLDHLGDVAARDPLGDDHDQLDAVLDRLEHGVLRERGGDRHDRAVDRRAVVGDRLGDRVEHRHAVDLAPEPPGRDAADDLRAGAVVEALARQVDGLAAGDALDDEGGVGVDQDAHALRLPRSSRRRAARPRSATRSGRRSRRRTSRGS